MMVGIGTGLKSEGGVFRKGKFRRMGKFVLVVRLIGYGLRVMHNFYNLSDTNFINYKKIGTLTRIMKRVNFIPPQYLF
jgi:hypothetical protein